MTIAEQKFAPPLTVPMAHVGVAWERLIFGGLLWYLGFAALWKSCEWVYQLAVWVRG